MRIYLIGYMASGKSNLGRHLADKLDYAFTDTDYLFEERFRISVLDFFAKYDEALFRNLERMLLYETTRQDDVVISTGGGTPCFFDNMHLINQAGISIYLHWEVADLVSRLKTVRRKRPLLKDVSPGELESKVAAHLTLREVFYAQAHLIIEGKGLNMDDLLERIKTRLNRD